MLTIFKKLFGQSEKKVTAPPAPATPAPPPTQFDSAIQIAKVEVARLSLKAIATKFPEEVRALLNREPDDTATVALPIQTILKQLPTGVVRMSFASLHRQAPAGLFKALPTGDKRMVEVPLAEVFKHVKPTALKRRSDQRAVVIEHDEELSGPLFNNASAPAAPVREVPEASAAAAEETPATETESAPAAMRVVAPPSELKLAGAASAPKATTKPAATKSAGASEPTLTFPLAQLTAGWPDEVLTALAALPPDTVVNVPHSCIAPGLARGKISAKWSAFRHWLSASANDLQVAEDTDLVLPLKLIAPAFLAATKAKVAPRKTVTVDDTIPALFSGGKPLAESPAAPEPEIPATPAPEAKAEAAPEPVAQEPVAKAEPEPVIAAPAEAKTLAAPPEVIEVPVAAAAPIEPAASADPTPEPAPAQPAPATVPAASAATLGDALGEPGKDKWTPAELVARVAKLDGVAGAVVALQEGFPVAHSLPSDVNPETVAAFLPQIFTRLNQYSGEMKLGEVDDLLFTTRGAHCLIYRMGTVYFAVLGKPGSPLPWNELRLVAAELSRQVTK